MTDKIPPDEIPPVPPSPPSRRKWVVLGLMVFCWAFIFAGLPLDTERDRRMAMIFPVLATLIIFGIGWFVIHIGRKVMWLPWPRRILNILAEHNDDPEERKKAAERKDRLKNPEWFDRE